MGDRFRMILRRKPGSIPASPLRSRRAVIPPKKDDLSVLTWKEQQMIEKAQLASLKTSSPKRVQSRRGRPRKYPAARDRDESSESEVDSEDEELAVSDAPSTPPPPLSPLSIYTNGSKVSKPGRGRPRKNGQRGSSNRRSPSGQSLGSIGSFPELLSPYLPVTPTGGGFAARKSAYTGAIGGSDDEDGEYVTRRRNHMSNAVFGNGRESSDEEEGPSGSPRRMTSIDSMPTTEDFISYLVLKGINCVPEELKYVGSLQWETIPLKRKSNSSVLKKASEIPVNGSPSASALVSPVVKPKQDWAKKAIERAKRSLVVKNVKKDRSHSVTQVSIKPKASKTVSPNGCAKMAPAPVGRPKGSTKVVSKHKVSKRSSDTRCSKHRGNSARVKSPTSKKLCHGCSKPHCR